MASTWSGASLAAAAATAGAVDGAALTTELTTETALAGFFVMAARTTATATASLSFLADCVTISAALTGRSAAGASLMVLLIAETSLSVKACAGVVAKHVRPANRTARANSLVFFIVFRGGSVYSTFRPSVCILSQRGWSSIELSVYFNARETVNPN